MNLPAPSCERCGEVLDPKTAVWLELDERTNLYCDPDVTPEDSQGWFAFGADCAKVVLTNGGKNVTIRRGGQSIIRPVHPGGS